MENYQKVSVEYPEALNIAIIHENWKRLNVRETVHIIEIALVFIMFLKVLFYWSYDRDICKGFQTVLIIETWEYTETDHLINGFNNP